MQVITAVFMLLQLRAIKEGPADPQQHNWTASQRTPGVVYTVGQSDCLSSQQS